LIAFFFYLEALESQLQVPHQTVNHAATTVNAMGTLLADRLQDILNALGRLPAMKSAREPQLATVQTQLGYEL
jgi:hypothetical protein